MESIIKFLQQNNIKYTLDGDIIQIPLNKDKHNNIRIGKLQSYKYNNYFVAHNEINRGTSKELKTYKDAIKEIQRILEAN